MNTPLKTSVVINVFKFVWLEMIEQPRPIQELIVLDITSWLKEFGVPTGFRNASEADKTNH